MEIKVTPREIIVSVAIVALMIILGLFIGDKVQDYEMGKQQEYITAIQIQEDADQFRYGMKTNAGKAFVYGNFKAVDAVTHEYLEGTYSYIERVREEYCRHTRTVTKTKTVNSKKVSYTETEVYYTWDRKGSEDWNCETISFLGVEFPYGKIERPPAVHVTTEKVSSKVRYQYYAAPAEAVGTIYTTLYDNTISDTTFYINKSIEKVYDSVTASFRVPLFWVFWSILTIAIIVGFVYLENFWLE